MTGGTEPVQIDVVITVTGANDAPAIAMVDDGTGTLVPASIDDQTGTVGDEITEIDLNGLFADVDTGDTFTLAVMVLADDGSKSGLDTLGLVYSDSTGLITGTIDGGVVPGTFTIEVVATDAQGAASEAYTFTIEVAAMLVRPTATPMTGITIDEDTSYAFPAGNDTLTALFGFADVSNSNGSPGDFTGVYIELASIDDGRLRLDDGTEVVSTTDLSGSDGAPVIDGYIYVTFSQLSNLNLVPAVDFNGDLTLSYRVWDGEASSEEDAVLTITVDPVNDVPVVESGNEIDEQAGRVGQDIVAIDLSGLFTDVDGDAVTLTVMVIVASARVELDATLGLTYDSGTKMITGTIGSDVSAGTYTIEVIATDSESGESQPSTFAIVVAPDSAPVIGGAMDGSIDEDAVDPTVTGTLTITDADGDDVPAVALDGDGVGAYGTMTFDVATGIWTYTLNNANADVQALLKDATLTEEFTFTAEGAAPITVTITINGVNEAPELVPGMEIEDQDGNVGQLIDPISESDLRALFADADTDNAALELTVMVLDSDGTTRTALDTIGLEYNSTDGIIGTPSAPGTYTIEVTASDGEESIAFTFDIVVVHPPVIGNDSPTEIGEDAVGPIMGTLSITDQDSSPPPPFLPIVLTDGDGTDDGMVTGDYGTLTFDSGTGGWSYMVDERAQALNDDTPGTDTFVFTSEGATDFELVITVTGANDDPTIAQVDDGTGTLVAASIDAQSGTEGEDVVIDLSGVFIDPDDVLTVVPTATLDSDGTAVTFDGTTNSFSYDPDTKMLTITLAAAGDYTVTVTASDGNGGATPSLDFALSLITQTISGDDTGAVTEDDNTSNVASGVLQSATGAITLSDDGDGDNSVDGTYGTIVLNPSDGTWTYTLDNARDVTQNLPGGGTEEDRFTFTDGANPLTVVITVTGANDAPAVESGNEIDEQAGQVGQEIDDIDLSGLFTDVDTGDTFTLTVMVLSSDGSTRTALDTTLGLTYDPVANAITGTIRSDVSAGTYTIEVIATDGGGSGDASAPSTFDIVVAADNPPVIGGDVDGTIDEDAVDSTGTLTITDADGDTVPAVALTDGAGQYGTLTFDVATGVWTYTLDNSNAAVQELGEGVTLTDTFTFTADGAEDVTVTITISGVNDAPVVESGNEIDEQSGRVGQEIDAIDLSGLFTDVDAGDSFTLTVMVVAGSTRVGLDTLGLEYNSTDGIIGTPSDAGTFTIEVIATDGSGAASQPSTFTIVVAADNAPVFGGDMAGSIDEDAVDPTVTGTLTITDADNDALPTVVLPDGAGQYGTLTFDVATGVWTYTLDNSNAAVQALVEGDTLTEEFTFTAEGAEDVVVTITINGMNEAPELVPSTEIEIKMGM